MILLLGLVLFLCVVLILYYFKDDGKYKFPPGPPRIPIIGSLISVALADPKNPIRAFEILGKRYGPIFHIQLGSVVAVVLNDHKTISMVSNSDDLLSHIDESDIWMLGFTNGTPIGMFNAFPEFWTATRTAVHKMLKRHGFEDKFKTIEITTQEYAHFCAELKKQMHNGEMILRVSNTFSNIFLNIVWTMLSGKKLDTNDPKYQRLRDAISCYLGSASAIGNFWNSFPTTLKLFPSITGFKAMKKTCVGFRSAISENIQAHIVIDCKTNAPSNFLQDYINKIEENSKSQSSDGGVYTDRNLEAILQDISIGGMDTQASLMKLFVKRLVTHHHVQEKLHEELINVVGKSGQVNAEDIPNLVYFQATCHELLRMGSGVPVTPRRLLKDWHFQDYFLPKGTQLLINIAGANMDEAIWKFPEKFDPERFLSLDGMLIDTEKLFSFGIGKRRCIGEQPARTNMIIAATSLVRNFSFHVDPGFGVPGDAEVIGLTRESMPFNVIVRSRLN